MIYRNYFGTWGRELSDGDFACALAALGVLDKHSLTGPHEDADERLELAPAELVQPVEWKLLRPFFAAPDLPENVSARDLAESWKRSGLPEKVRLEVDRSSTFYRVDSAAMLPWVVSELSRPEVKARSVYLRVDRPSVTVGWQWPARIGFLGDEESQELKKRLDDVIQGEGWIRPLVRAVDAEQSRSGCDILLIPAGIRKSLSLAAGLSRPVHADCTIVIGRTEGDAAHWYRMVEGLRASLRTSGVVVAQRGTDDIEKWFMALVANLSHNNSIDAALFMAATERGEQPPFIAISRRLAEFSRLSMQMRRMAKKMKRPGMREMRVEIEAGSPAARTLDVGAGTHTLDRIGDSLETTAAMGESEIEPGGFIHERDAATGSVSLDRSVTMATAAAAPSPAAQEERFIQAKVFDLTNPAEPVRRSHRLRGGASHQIVVRIGEQDQEWISTPAGPSFPVDSLPQDQDEWELTVVLSVAQSSDDPQVSRILLPRFGNSSEAAFFLVVKEEWKSVEARIIVLHRNRVIQTAMLEAEVGGREDLGDDDHRITVEPEVVAKTRFDNLADRERFDAALVLNESKAGIKRLLAIADDKVAKFTPGPTMDLELANIDTLLADIVENPKSYMGKLTSKPVVDLLRTLANHGNALYDHIVRDGGLAAVHLDGDGPLQVISAVADARLPIELVYSRRAPKPTAKLCPRAAASLRKGKCDASCTKLGKQSDFICPLAFWGVQRVIERHAHRPELKKVTAGEDFAVVSEPTDLRPELDLFKGGAIAGSQKVEKTVAGGLEQISRLVGKLTNSNLEPVPDWKSWKTSIRKTGPSLLVLIVHTEETPADDTIPQMEIGNASWLSVVEIEEEHVVKKNGEPPLVLLLGCETGVPDKQFANFVNRLRNRGAAIVVATGAKIHSLHAVPVAKEFVTRIQEAAKKKDATFGEVMLAVRREMLADGIPMVLTLNAFGDADWRLAKHT
ncbi:MAG: hypothetical protein ABI681_08145 [Gemmatimonadales bacterium]